MPLIFRNFLFVYYLNSNFQPSTPLVTLYLGNSACAEKNGIVQLWRGGGKQLNWREGQCPLLPRRRTASASRASSNHRRHYCCSLFPKPLHLDLEVLIHRNLFDLFSLNSTVFWYCDIIEPHLLLLNHCDVWYVVRQMFISLNFEIP